MRKPWENHRKTGLRTRGRPEVNKIWYAKSGALAFLGGTHTNFSSKALCAAAGVQQRARASRNSRPDFWESERHSRSASDTV